MVRYASWINHVRNLPQVLEHAAPSFALREGVILPKLAAVTLMAV